MVVYGHRQSSSSNHRLSTIAYSYRIAHVFSYVISKRGHHWSLKMSQILPAELTFLLYGVVFFWFLPHIEYQMNRYWSLVKMDTGNGTLTDGTFAIGDSGGVQARQPQQHFIVTTEASLSGTSSGTRMKWTSLFMK